VFEQRTKGGHLDCLLLGTALALEVSGTVSRRAEGIDLAREAIRSGRAARVLERLATLGRAEVTT